MGQNLLILFKERIFRETLDVGMDLAAKTGMKVKIFAPKLEEEVKKHLSGKAELFSYEGDPKEIIERENPFLVVLPRPKIAPIVHAFKKPWSEKIAEGDDKHNYLLVQEGAKEIKKVLFYVDRDLSSENYIRTVYGLLTQWGVDFKFTTVFDERYFELLIKKEHPEEEAKELLRRMFEDYVKAVRERLKKILGLEKIEILSLKGEVRKTLPYFAKTHGYDLLVLSHAYEDKNELIENSETSVAIFKN
ncbi:MAG TPA: universal stress protein [Aquifex aeolicus]|uniref:Universal stress protein n=1 Tax=Aquifex aeolicus TaxID=63363 RepID=A0A9D1CGB6_AQUAO|nr:universal stress protein [Aquifex aeolicus]